MHETTERMIKAELHSHTADDPTDAIPHSTTDLIDRAAALGFGALAVTLHDHQLPLRRFIAYAADRDVVLIAGVERTIAGKHVLLLNFDDGIDDIDSFDDLRRLRQRTPDGLVIAPHPFYPTRSCLRGLLTRHADLFDAVEFNGFYTPSINPFNTAAVRWAQARGKTVVANSDLHRLWQLGITYSVIKAVPTADAICRAIRAGHVEVHIEPLSTVRAAAHFADLLVSKLKPSPRSTPGARLRLGRPSTRSGR